jgi:hypothetical protein
MIAWLIKKGGWGIETKYLSMDRGVFVWIKDSSLNRLTTSAIKFADKESAEIILRNMAVSLDGVSVEQHMWPEL